MHIPVTSLSSVLIFMSALLFSSLGVGGSAGYLAIFSMLAIPAKAMSASVLVINVLVGSVTLRSFLKAGHKPLPELVPFLITSVPAAFITGACHVQDSTYAFLLALALIAAAAGVAVSPHKPDESATESGSTNRSPIIPPLAGLVLGAISGLVGIGGGVLLSPLLVLLKWDTVKRISATTAMFSLVNSLAGLAGRCVTTTIDFALIAPLIVAAVVGAAIGSQLGAKVFSPRMLRQILAVILAGVSLRLFTTSAPQTTAQVNNVLTAAKQTLHLRTNM